MKISKKSLVMMLPLLGLMSMGNQSCQQSSANKRQLKKLVEFKGLDAKPINLGTAGTFDFQWVATSQIYSVLFKSQAFTFKIAPTPTTTVPSMDAAPVQSKSTLDLSDVNLGLKAGDLAQYENWVLEKNGGNYQEPTFSNEARCMINLPQLSLAGSINSFEAVGGGGLSIGYSPTGPTTNLGGSLSFKVEYAQLNLSMNAIDPLSNFVKASTTIDQKQTKTNLNFMLNLVPFAGGLDYWSSTPLATVTQKALTKAVLNIAGQVSDGKPGNEWYTRVLHDLDPELAIIGGANMGLQVGDQLAIYNDLHAWSGEACNSTYIGGASIKPSAIVEVVGLGDELSYVTIKERFLDPVVGAKVKMYKFAGEAAPKALASKK
ncbi:MAG: hypothetical protein V4736_07780 [Bdellovibrionota bacterium]